MEFRSRKTACMIFVSLQINHSRLIVHEPSLEEGLIIFLGVYFPKHLVKIHRENLIWSVVEKLVKKNVARKIMQDPISKLIFGIWRGKPPRNRVSLNHSSTTHHWRFISRASLILQGFNNFWSTYFVAVIESRERKENSTTVFGVWPFIQILCIYILYTK